MLDRNSHLERVPVLPCRTRPAGDSGQRDALGVTSFAGGQ